MDAESSSSNGSVIAAASLSVVSTLGVIGTCLMNHRDTIMDKARCWIGWGATPEPDKEEEVVDLEAQRSSTVTGLVPNISFPIVINNNSGEQKPACVTLSPSPFEDRDRPRLERTQSDPTFDSSDHHSDTSPASRGTTTTDSSDVIFRRISLDRDRTI